MKKLVLLLLLLPLCVFGQSSAQKPVVFHLDSLNIPSSIFILNDSWKFHEADSPAMALPGYDDRAWPSVDPTIRSSSFNSIGWFRLHFIVDSSFINYPLALTITHLGASELFLDGKKIDSFGVIGDRNHTQYYDPQNVPFPFQLTAAGEHVLAVRYANFDAQKNHTIYHSNFKGFRMTIGGAKYFFSRHHRIDVTLTLIYGILLGIFTALALTHLFLFLFYRASGSNLFFSIFCFSLSGIFILCLIAMIAHSPSTQLNERFVAIFLFGTACFSYSGLTNNLFSTKKVSFRVATALCALTAIVLLFNQQYGTILALILVIFVSIEGIALTSKAIYRKVKGARIIGAGILISAIYICANIAVSLILNIDLSNDSTEIGQINELIAAIATLSIPLSMSSYLAWSFSKVNKDLTKNLQHVEALSRQALEQEQEKKRMLETQNEKLEQEVTARTSEIVAQRDKIEKQHSELKVEKKKSDDLLLNILPEEIAEELKEKGRSSARLFNEVSVLFTDFVDFTKAAESMAPQQLVDELDVCFKAFDDIISAHGIEKIKTIGDAYLAVCGLPLPDSAHAEKVATASLQIIQFMTARKLAMGSKTFEVRVGLHSGSVVAGIVGVKKFAYDIWGDTVNTAARMEQNSAPGRVNISQTTYDLVKDKFHCTHRGQIAAKNKGDMNMYFIDGAR